MGGPRGLLLPCYGGFIPGLDMIKRTDPVLDVMAGVNMDQKFE
jgi:hypothetical protein